MLDPDLGWASFLGGVSTDVGNAVGYDRTGDSPVITGSTMSADFPVSGGTSSILKGTQDAFVSKFTNAGQLTWSTYFGGTSTDEGLGVAVDTTGNVFVTGDTSSADFVTTSGFDRILGGTSDAFITKLSSTGALLWSSFLGGTGTDQGRAVAVDSNGNAYLTGNTASSDFTTTGGFDTTLSGSNDAFVTKVTSAGTLAWSSYLGGELTDTGNGIAVTATGAVDVVGVTTSTSGLATAGTADNVANGGSDAFVASITLLGTKSWATYLGGTLDDSGKGIAVDTAGNIYITGSTTSTDFPTQNPRSANNAGGSDVFISSLSNAGTLTFSTYLGGTLDDSGNGIAFASQGTILVTGTTQSSDFPTSQGFDLSYNGGLSDAFVLSLSVSGSINWSSFLGGSSPDLGMGVAADALGNVYVVGSTQSTDFPALRAVDTIFNGATDAFLAKVNASTNPQLPSPPAQLTAVAISFTENDLHWLDTSNNETGFRIVRKTGSSGKYSVMGTVRANLRTYRDMTVEPDTVYYYRVRSFNASGDSFRYSNAARVQSKSANVGQPTGVVATAISSKRVDVVWLDNSDNEKGFEIWREESSLGNWAQIGTVGAGVTSYTDQSGLLPETEYGYEIRGFNDYKESDFSDAAFVTTKAVTYMIAPTGLTAAKVSDASVKLDWQDNSDNETGFEVERTVAGSNDFTQIGTTGLNVSTFTDNTVVAGTFYTYRVRAMNATEESAYTNLATSDLAKALATPTRFEAVAQSPDSILLTWRDNAIIETAYMVQRRTNSNGDWQTVRTLAPETTTYTDRDLLANTIYQYRIFATDGAENSGYSRVATDRTLKQFTDVPRTPSAVKAKVQSSSSIRLWWHDNSNNETSFTIERATSLDGPFVVVDTVGENVTTYKDTGLASGTTYYYRIRARTDTVRSPASPIVNATTTGLA